MEVDGRTVSLSDLSEARKGDGSDRDTLHFQWRERKVLVKTKMKMK